MMGNGKEIRSGKRGNQRHYSIDVDHFGIKMKPILAISTSANDHHRIAIIGNAGGGKTTFACKLGECLSLPTFHIDDLQWEKSWQRKPDSEFKKTHSQLMELQSWIIDGVGLENGLYTRLHRAQIIIFIDLPLEEHLRLAKQRESAPMVTSPNGCSYEGMFDRVAEIILYLNSTLIPKLRKDIPSIAKQTDAIVYGVSQVSDLEHLHNELVTKLALKNEELENLKQVNSGLKNNEQK